MAIIYSYPRTSPSPGDLLLLNVTTNKGNETKTATINDILGLLPPGSGGGGIANIQSNNSNFLSVTNPSGPLVTLSLQTGSVASGGNTLATTGDIYSFTNASITEAINNLPVGVSSFACDISNIPAFSKNVTTSSTGAVTLTISRTGGSANQFLRYDGIWATPLVQGMTSWPIKADTGGGDKVEQGTEVNFVGKGKISTEFVTQSANPNGLFEILITHDSQTQTNTTPSTTLTNGGTFTALSENVGIDGDGHVTGQVLRTYTLPSVGGVNSVSVTSPVTDTGTSSDPVIGVDLSSKQDLLVSGTNIKTINAQSLLGSGNITISGGGGTGVTGVGVNISTNIPALTVTPTSIASGSSGIFEFGIDSSSGGASEYLDGSGNWSVPSGTSVTLGNNTSIDSVTITASPGSGTTIGDATTTRAGVMNTTQVAKLNGIEAGAEVNVQSNWNETDTTSDRFIQNKPTIPTQFSWTLDGDTGSNPVSDGATIEIVGGTGIDTAVSGNTLTVTNTSPGTVESIGVANTAFITGATSESISTDPITAAGTLEYSLSALGNANATSFLRGDNKWSVLKNGKGINQISFSTANPDYGTVLSVEYTGSNNVVKSANTPGTGGWGLTDTVIINQASSDVAYEATLQSIKDAVVTSQVPVAFSVDASGNIQNSGNIADNPQGFGPITTAINSAGDGIDISFSKTLDDTNYMVNFTVEEPLVSGGQDYAVNAWVPPASKTKSGFTILYDKGGTGTGLGVPELTNFQLYR